MCKFIKIIINFLTLVLKFRVVAGGCRIHKKECYKIEIKEYI